MKKHLFKDLIILCVIVAAAALIAVNVKIQSVGDYYLTNPDAIPDGSETVFLSIECGVLLKPENWNKLADGLKDEKYVPEDGVILAETKYLLRSGDTVFKLLSRAARYNKIPLVHQGASRNIYNSVYIQGINHLFERSCGDLSGWVYYVNGVSPGLGCGEYKPKDKDKIEWKYTCDIGNDTGGFAG